MQVGTLGPKSFGPYEIVGSLGEGGGGHVFRAWDPRLRREVALKILHDRSATAPERIARLLGEARAASALNHPNILTVFDASVDGATPFIVSELIDGPTLRDEIRRGAVPLRRLLDLATQIADGLAAAHDAHIVHRDLKPENIMIAKSGRLKILDFGLAWPRSASDDGVERSTEQTATDLGLRAGTVPYMSPEQARGAGLDFRSDQFSFGLILYEMATGRVPFRRDTPAATLDAVINEDLPPIAFADPRAPALLRWIIERCLAKAPEDRYGSTADLYRDLRTLRDRLAEAVVPDAGGQRGEPAIWRRMRVAAGMTAGALAGVFLAHLLGVAPDAGSSELQFRPFATASEYEGQPAWSPDGQTIAYAKEVDGVLQIHTRGVSSSNSAAVTRQPYDCRHPFWSGDGKRIYYVSLAQEREGIWSVGAAGGTPQLVVKNANKGAISPDGKTFAFLRDEARGDIVPASGVYLSSPQGEAPWSPDAVEAAAKRYVPIGKLRFVEAGLTFSPDGRKLGIAGVGEISNLDEDARGWQFWVIPLDGSAPYRKLRSLPDVAPRESRFDWLPDNRHVVLGLHMLAPSRSHLYLADLDRDTAWPLTRSADAEQHPSTSPDGSRIVFVRGEPDFDLTEVSLVNKGIRTLLSTARNESDPSWSPDGREYSYVTDRRGQDEIWIRSRDGSSDRPVITQDLFGNDPTVMLSAPTFSPDGQRLAYVRTGSRPIWPLRIYTSLVAGGTPVPLMPSSHDGVQVGPTWSPDGQWVAFSEWRDRKWMLVKVRVGNPDRIELRTDGVPNATPQWSPNDDWITWETANGFVLVSPDGKTERTLATGQLLAHAWSRSGKEILGIEETEDLRLSLVAVGIDNRGPRLLADLGPSPPVNNQVKGLSLAHSGESVATSTVHMRGDLWIVSGIEFRDWLARLWQGLRKSD